MTLTTENPVLSEAELAYVAGIIDGEGCISIGRNKHRPSAHQYTHKVQMRVTNTDKRLLYWLQERWPTLRIGDLPQQEKCKPQYQIAWHAGYLVHILELLLPYLVLKREQAVLALVFLSTVQYSRRPISVDVFQRREDMWALMRAFNKKGMSTI